MNNETTILIVEDNPTTLKQIVQLVQRIIPTARILTAADGVYGLFAAWHAHPNLIITSLALPQVDGIELVRVLRRDPINPQIPIIGLSSSGADPIKAKAFQRLCNEFLAKPFASTDLRQKIAALLQLIHRNSFLASGKVC